MPPNFADPGRLIARFGTAAQRDHYLPLIGHGEEMLAPKTVGRLLQALRLAPADAVLEVGTGTGYVTACLALLGGNFVTPDAAPDLLRALGRLTPNGWALEAFTEE